MNKFGLFDLSVAVFFCLLNASDVLIPIRAHVKWGVEINCRTSVAHSTKSITYSTELAFSWNMSHLIDVEVAFYMHLIRQFDSAQVKCDV